VNTQFLKFLKIKKYFIEIQNPEMLCSVEAWSWSAYFHKRDN